MVRPPKIRHSKGRRDPVTIDLDPAEVTREAAASGPKTKQAPEATPAPKPAEQDSAMTKKPSDATPAAKDAPIRTAPAEETTATAKAEAPKSSPGTPGERRPEAKGSAADQPVFGRDASASAASRAATPPHRPAAAPSAGSGSADRAAPKRGGLSMIAAGVIGGIVVLAGAGALQYAGVLPSPGSSVEPGEPAGLADLRAELAALRDEVAAGGNAAQPDPAQAARLDEIAGTVEQLRTDVTELRSAVSQGEGGDAAGLQALDQRMSELEATVAALGQSTGSGGGEPVDLAPLTGRIDAVESQLAEVSRAAQAASEASAGLPDRIAALDQRIAALDTRVGELSARIEDQAANPRIALAIAAAGLKAAIDRGDPFMTELETYASIAPNAPEIADLRGLAATGVPTRAAISQEVDAAANRMIAAAAPPAGDAGFFGRLLDSMQSVIKVRPVGDVEGDDVGAIVARLEAAILAGDYDRAVGQYEALPEPARQAGAEFIARVKARQTADALVERALSGALRPQEG
ncbi:MAG: phage tail protein [Mesorhizobium sp.]